MKIRHIAFLLLALAALGALSGCVTLGYSGYYGGKIIDPEGVVETRSYEVEDFDGVITEASIHRLYIHLANGEKEVQIEADRAYLDAISVTHRQGDLHISADGTLVERVDIYLTAAEFANIDCRGAATLLAQEGIAGDELRFSVEGACSGDMKLEYNRLDLNIAGAGEISLLGEVADVDIDCAGAATIDAKELQTQRCNVDLSGVGNVQVRCEQALRATIGGLGTVEYWGDASVEKVIGGLGEVIRRDD